MMMSDPDVVTIAVCGAAAYICKMAKGRAETQKDMLHELEQIRKIARDGIMLITKQYVPPGEEGRTDLRKVK
jgi:hypothetical protein